MDSYPAPAKLNLMLRVTGRRADGYHKLQTVFRFIDLTDQIHFEVRNDGRLARVHEILGVPTDQDLTLRAARLLQRESKSRCGVDISLNKRLPMGSGLGGGSSDAATTLIVLNRLWQINMPRAQLQALALELGADVPVFVFGESALGEGVGEILTALPLPPAWYVVLVPAVSISTAEIFQDPDLIRDSNPIKIPPFSAEARSNDLQAVVCRRYPEVTHYLDWLKQFGPAWVTGSGACVFGEFTTEAQAQAVMQCLPVPMRGFIARGLDRHPLWQMSEQAQA